MYKINQLELPIGFDKENLAEILSKKIKVDKSRLLNVSLSKLSIDARDKNALCYKASIIFDVTGKFDYRKFKNIQPYIEEKSIPLKWSGGDKNIIIVGSGPSGLFAGLALSESGAKVTILERGYDMQNRKKAVDLMMEKGELSEVSNIQFGEGGAGTFSDGKLNTGIKSKYIKDVLNTFYKFGANENILYDARPHIGTDILSKVIVNMREHIKSLGSKVLFEHKLTNIKCQNGEIKSVEVQTPNGIKELPCDILILAVGHSSRDTMRMLFDKHIELKQKPFSMGFRIEHLQEDINKAQYGTSALSKKLPPADYHLVEHLEDGRVVYSFCMCPGGVVVPAMSERGTIVTNGMSYNARDKVNSNSALLVGVNTSDFPSSQPLAGLEMQEKYERYAFNKTGSYRATVQRVGDFLDNKPTEKLGKVQPSYTPGYVLGSVEDMLPDYIINSIRKALPRLGKKIQGFDDKDAILTGVETRSSAPYQFVRDNEMMSSIKGIYAIGEGAGFAGGIVSSAVEGLKCASIICNKNS